MPVEERWLMDRVKGGHVTHDSPCAACGYNLIGLKRSGVCPECGTPMRGVRSAGATGVDLMHMARSVLWSLAFATLCMFGGALAMGLSWLAMGTLVRMGAAGRLSTLAAAALGGAAWLLGVAIISLYKPPALEREDGPHMKRWVLAGLAIGTQALWPAAAGIVLLNSPTAATSRALDIMAVVCGMVASLGLAPTILALRKLLWSVNDEKMHERLLVLVWSLPILLVLRIDELTLALTPSAVAVWLAFAWLPLALARFGLVVWLLLTLAQAAHTFWWAVRNQKEAEADAARLRAPDPRFRVPEDGVPIANPLPKHTASPKLFGGR